MPESWLTDIVYILVAIPPTTVSIVSLLVSLTVNRKSNEAYHIINKRLDEIACLCNGRVFDIGMMSGREKTLIDHKKII